MPAKSEEQRINQPENNMASGMKSNLITSDLSYFFSISHNLAATLTTAGSFLEINPAWGMFFNYQPEQLAGSFLADYVHPKDYQLVKQSLARLNINESRQQAVLHFRHQNGSYQIIDCQFARHQDVIYLIATNITETEQVRQLQKQLEKVVDFEQLLLEQSSALFSAPDYEISPIIEHTLARIGEYLHVDRVYIFRFNHQDETMSNLYEWCAEKITPMINLLQDLPTSTFPCWMEKLHLRETILIPEVANLPNEWIAEREMLAMQSVRSVLVLPIAAHETLYGFMGFDATRAGFAWGRESHNLLRFFANNIGSVWYRDVAKRKLLTANHLSGKLARQFEQASQEKSNFLAQISHDLRVPMNAVTGMTYLLLDTSLNARQKQYADRILAGGQAMLKVINSVLDLSRIESGNLELKSAPFHLNNLLNRIKELYSSQANEKNLIIAVTLSPDIPPYLTGDEGRLQQILSNLLSNAIKYSNAGTIKIDADLMLHIDDICDLSICVSDEGMGIHPDEIDHIFSPFWRSSHNHDEDHTGTGLGLPISKQLSELMGGSLHVSSNPGQGSTFCLKLPFTVANKKQSAGLKQKSVSDLSAASMKATVLIVDDHPINLEICQYFLSQMGITSDTAADGQDALEQLKAYPDRYDLVLMDIEMPRLNGVEATRLIRQSQDPRLADIPIIALTAHALSEERKTYLKAGMQDQVNKPVDPVKLRQTLCQFLQKEKHSFSPAKSDSKNITNIQNKDQGVKPICDQAENDALLCDQAESDALLCDQAESDALLCDQAESDALLCDQAESDALLCDQAENSGLVFSFRQSLEELYGDQYLLNRMLRRYLNDYANLDKQLTAANQNNDIKTMKALLHHAKSVHSAIGSQVMASCSKALELILTEYDKDKLNANKQTGTDSITHKKVVTHVQTKNDINSGQPYLPLIDERRLTCYRQKHQTLLKQIKEYLQTQPIK